VTSSDLAVTVGPDSIRVGERFELSLQRTLRIPEDGETYPLPPGLGRLPLLPSSAAGGRLPAQWRDSGDVLAPLYQREAVWLAFGGATWKPNAVQIGVGAINAVSGEPWSDDLSAEPQDYVVAPIQPWLDGVNAGVGTVRQFVALPLGSGRSVEAQLTGGESDAGLRVRVYEPRPGRFPDEPPPPSGPRIARFGAPGMGLGAGGAIRQKLYPDPYGVDTWDPEHTAEVRIRLLNSELWTELTGQPVPPTPVSAEAYAEHGLPWFELYDEHHEDLAPSARLAGVQGTADQPEPGARPSAGSIHGIRRGAQD
jgi:hypothetical protein